MFEIDHVIPEKMRGSTDMANLALACFHCNNSKGPNIAGIDPMTEQPAFLFSPRKDIWSEHFAWNGARLEGLTPSGRATVELLEINRPDRIAVRQSLIVEGVLRVDRRSSSSSLD
jgi:hypothetical protein